MTGYNNTLITAQVAGTAYANSTTANTPLQPAAATFTFVPNFFFIGKKLRLSASGTISYAAGTASFTWGLAFGSLATPIIVFNAGAIPFPGAGRAATNVTFDLRMDYTCRAIGSGTSANGIGTGVLTSEATVSSAAAGSTGVAALPASAPAVGTGFDSTIANVCQLVGTWSTASASNTVQVLEYDLTDLTFTP